MRVALGIDVQQVLILVMIFAAIITYPRGGCLAGCSTPPLKGVLEEMCVSGIFGCEHPVRAAAQ